MRDLILIRLPLYVLYLKFRACTTFALFTSRRKLHVGIPRGVVWFAILGRNLSSLKRVGNIEWVLDTIMSDEDRDVDIESDVIIHVTI